MYVYIYIYIFVWHLKAFFLFCFSFCVVKHYWIHYSFPSLSFLRHRQIRNQHLTFLGVCVCVCMCVFVCLFYLARDLGWTIWWKHTNIFLLRYFINIGGVDEPNPTCEIWRRIRRCLQQLILANRALTSRMTNYSYKYTNNSKDVLLPWKALSM